MYLTAHRVWSRTSQREAVHAFFYRHATPLIPPIDVSWIADHNPGELLSSSVELPPAGNDVRSYLDIVASEDIGVHGLTALVEALAQDVAARSLVVRNFKDTGARFSAVPSISDRRKELLELGAAIRDLYVRGESHAPIRIRIENRPHSVRYSLDPESDMRLRKLRGPDQTRPAHVVVDRDTLEALEDAQGPIEEQVIPILSGLDMMQIHAIGGVEFLTETGSHRAVQPGMEATRATNTPPFPNEEVIDSLQSSIAARRTRGFAIAESAVGRGAMLPDRVRVRVEDIALDMQASRADRWRAIDLLRLATLRSEVRGRLLLEWATVNDSSIEPMEGDSGPVPLLLHEFPSSIDEILRFVEQRSLASLNRFVIRDILVAMRAQLLTRPEAVQDDQARRWKQFALRTLSERAPSQMATNDPVLVKSIIQAIDGYEASS